MRTRGEKAMDIIMAVVLGSIGVCTAAIAIAGTVWILAQIIGALT